MPIFIVAVVLFAAAVWGGFIPTNSFARLFGHTERALWAPQDPKVHPAYLKELLSEKAATTLHRNVTTASRTPATDGDSVQGYPPVASSPPTTTAQAEDLKEAIAAEASRDVAALDGTRSALQVVTARIFASRDIDPSAYLAFGIVAFPDRPSDRETEASRAMRDRMTMLCSVFLNTIPHTSETGETPKSTQVITIWPMNSPGNAQLANRVSRAQTCDVAVPNYGLDMALPAVAAAVNAGKVNPSRRGPYLMSWMPGADFGDPGRPILFDDLSDVNLEEHARERFRRWIVSIANSDAYIEEIDLGELEEFRLAVRDWADRDAARVMCAIKSLGEKEC